MSKRFPNKNVVVWIILAFCGLGLGLVMAEQQDTPPGYDPKGKRDPFSPLVRDGRFVSVNPDGLSAGSQRLVLGGILWDPGGHSLALINDTEVKVGDPVGAHRVAEISQDAVVLVGDDGESLVLQITFEEQPKLKKEREPRGGKQP